MTRLSCKQCSETVYRTNAMGRRVSQLWIRKRNGDELPEAFESHAHFYRDRRIVDIDDRLAYQVRKIGGRGFTCKLGSPAHLISVLIAKFYRLLPQAMWLNLRDTAISTKRVDCPDPTILLALQDQPAD